MVTALVRHAVRASNTLTTNCTTRARNLHPRYPDEKSKHRELEEKLSRTGTGVDAVAAEIKDTGKPSGNMQWLFVGIWVAFYFFLNNHGS